MPDHLPVTTVGGASELAGAGRASNPVAAGSGIALANWLGGTLSSGAIVDADSLRQRILGEIGTGGAGAAWASSLARNCSS